MVPADFDQDHLVRARARECVCLCVVDLLVTRTPGLVEIPSKSAVKSLSVLYYRLVSRIAESGSNRSALYEPDVNGALIGAPLREKPDSRNESTFRAAAYVRESQCNKSPRLRDLVPRPLSFRLN